MVKYGLPVAQKIKPSLETTDLKKFIELVQIIKDNEDIYAGQGSSLSLITALLYGYGEMGRVPFMLDALGIDKARGLLFLTESQRFNTRDFGNVHELGDLHHIKEQIDSLFSRLELNEAAKPLVELMEKKWGLTLIGNIPNSGLYTAQGIKLLFVLSALVAVQSSKELKEGFGVASGGGGGHGGH